MSALKPDQEDDLARRFGGLQRLYGAAAYARIRGAAVAVVGLGGVGSWAAEALARSGVARLILVDLDHVAESNINRQVQALGSTLGQAKVEAMTQRIRDIHPGCDVVPIDAFASEDNWPGLLPPGLDGVIDACDQIRAKAVLASWAREARTAFVSVGAAGGKQRPQDVQVDDLSSVTHDPLLASLRQRLRKHHDAPRQGPLGVRCVYSREPVLKPVETLDGCAVDGSLNCHGYGSSVTVTATFGFTAAADLLNQLKTGL